jgi:hypothetical protein
LSPWVFKKIPPNLRVNDEEFPKEQYKYVKQKKPAVFLSASFCLEKYYKLVDLSPLNNWVITTLLNLAHIPPEESQ